MHQKFQRVSNRTCIRFSRRLTLLLLWVHALQLQAQDWPQWQGPNENNQVGANEAFEPDLKQWNIAWSTDVGLGYSSITTAGRRAVTLGHDGHKKETVICIELDNGKTLWKYSYPAALIAISHSGGPNASATIAGESVYTLSKDGQLHGLNLLNGEERWKVNLTQLLEIEIPRWGFACSPLIHGDSLILSTGKLVAFDRTTGALQWISNQTGKAAYGTPRLFSFEGEDYLAAMDAEGLSVYKAWNGQEVARHRIRGIKYGVTANTPIALQHGQRLLIHTNAGSSLLSFNGSKLGTVWSDRKLQNSLSTFITKGSVFYGLNGLPEEKKTSLFCRNLSDGSVAWTVPEFGYGSLITVDNKLIILTEEGELVSAPAKDSGYEEISRVQLLGSVCWTAPSYAKGKIFLRNDQGVLLCLEQG